MINHPLKFSMMLVTLFVTTLSGCRFGNHSDSPTQINPGSITHSELFSTEVRSLKTYAYFSGNSYTSDLTANISHVPSDLLQVFTNPVYWDTYQDSSTTQFFWDNTKVASPFLTYADASGQINTETAANAATVFYRNANCLTQVQTLQEGNLDRSHPTTTILNGATAQSVVSGNLTLDVTRLQVFQGDCAADLQTLAACSANGAGCDTDQLARAKIFDLYLNQTGALNIADAPRIIGLAYIVHFE